MENATLATMDPRTATASDIQALLQRSSLTSLQLVQLYIERIQTYNSYLRAVISTPPTHLLLEAATKLDRERAQGKVRSGMHGIPILIKVWNSRMKLASYVILNSGINRTILPHTPIWEWTPQQAVLHWLAPGRKKAQISSKGQGTRFFFHDRSFPGRQLGANNGT